MVKRTGHVCMVAVEDSYFLHECEHGSTYDVMGSQPHGLVGSGLSPKAGFSSTVPSPTQAL